MTKKRIIIGLIILAALGGFFFLKKRNGKVLVTKANIEEVAVRKTVSASGTVTSVYEADLAFPATGQIEYIGVNKGDLVTEGHYLANVYNFDSSQSAQAAKDGRDVAQRDLEIYIENYDTYPNAVGGRDEYELNIKRLKELLSRAEANYQASLGTLTKTYLYAPFSGTVIDVYYDKGEVVTFGTPIMKVADLENLIFEINVDQEDFGQLKVGQKVEVTLDSYEDALFLGTVSELPKYADEETDEFLIKIKLESSTEKPILLGMNGDATIIVENTENAVPALTFDVIYQNGDGYYVWVDDGGLLKKEYLEIGLEGDIYTEISSSLDNKQIVVPVDEEHLEDGAKIKYEE